MAAVFVYVYVSISGKRLAEEFKMEFEKKKKKKKKFFCLISHALRLVHL